MLKSWKLVAHANSPANMLDFEFFLLMLCALVMHSYFIFDYFVLIYVFNNNNNCVILHHV